MVPDDATGRRRTESLMQDFMRVLVTGSSGLVGDVLTRRFSEKGIHVVPFDLRAGGADIRDAAALREAMRGCDGVIHLAAVSRVAWGEADPDLCRAINEEGTANVADAALSQPHRPFLIHASSREVYGNLARLPARESDAAAPHNAYGRSKVASERIVGDAAGLGLPVGILRLSNVYGTTNDHPDRAVPSLLWNAIRGQDLRISGADIFFDFVHVEDCVRGFLALTERLAARRESVPAIHLTTGVATSLGKLAEMAIGTAGGAASVTAAPSRSFDVSGFVGDPALAGRLLGWRHHIDLAEGLSRLRDDLIQRGRALDPVPMPDSTALPKTLPHERIDDSRRSSAAESQT